LTDDRFETRNNDNDTIAVVCSNGIASFQHANNNKTEVQLPQMQLLLQLEAEESAGPNYNCQHKTKASAFSSWMHPFENWFLRQQNTRVEEFLSLG